MKISWKLCVAFATVTVAYSQTAGGRGASGGGRGVVQPAQRTNTFPFFMRPLAPADVLARGKALYDANCASCHAPDLRGMPEKKAPNLIRSTEMYDDQKGEHVASNLLKHKPVINLPATDSEAIAEYVHSILATMGPQGSPPGRNPVGLTYNVLIGDPKAGEAAFGKFCVSCHSATGDMAGIATKYPDPKTLQNRWVLGGGRGRGGQQATVTYQDGRKVEGTLVRRDDFVVVLTMADGSRRSIARSNDLPKVDVKDPQEGHKKMLLQLDDPEDKNLHDVTAYLATLK